MKRKLASVAVAALSAGVLVGVAYNAARTPAAAATAETYTWNNAQIVGGGFVDGIIYNQTTPNLVYARTDIGGAYRLDPNTKRWIPLNDAISSADYNLLGALSLATDPVNPQRVYIAAGEYTQSWAGNAAILRSSDQGATWQRTDLSFKLGGNQSGRSMGERLQIDPNSPNILFLGTNDNGLWKSTDYGVTWSQVTSFPVLGQTDLGIGNVVIDKSSGTSGSASKTIYVGVADTTTPIYKSTDGGATWSALAGQPSAGMPHHIALASDGTIYVTYGDQAGPYTMYNGAVYKLSGGVWTDITPLKPYTNGEGGFGYAGLAVDPQHPGWVMAATMGRWGPVDDIFRSVDYGVTWVSITSKKVMDTSLSPWLNWHGTPKLGWMIGALQINPFNSAQVMFGTGATIYGSDDVTNAEAGGSTHWSVRAQGLEETAVQDIVSPPSGPPLISALGDIGVFVHNDLTVSPPNGMATGALSGTSTSVDFEEQNPTALIVGVGNSTSTSPHRMGYSTDGGNTWTAVASEPESPNGAGQVAVSADGTHWVWTPDQRGAYYTTDKGTTWTASAGLPANAKVRSDRVNPSKFYSVYAGTFYVSTNGGASFTAAATTLPTGGSYFKTVPGHEGDIWLATYNGGLLHSTNSGASFTQVATGIVTEADTIGLGKAAPGQTYPALYLNGVVSGVTGIFRSDDAGATWVRINDDQHQWGWTGQAITGDPRVYGRVYVSTNGRGIIYGDRTGSTSPTPSTSVSSRSASPSPSPSVSPSRSVSPSVSASRSVSPSPSTSVGGTCSVTYTVAGQWQGGFQGAVDITNTGTAAVNGWTLTWTFANGQQISQVWGATATQTGATVSAVNASYNATIAAKGTVSLGFLASWTGTNANPTAFSLNGSACALG